MQTPVCPVVLLRSWEDLSPVRGRTGQEPLFAFRRHYASLATLALAALATVGCGADSPSSTARAVSFRASAGPNQQPFHPSDSQTILNLGDLTIRASCARGEGGQPFLNVGAETSVDHAVVSSHYTKVGSPPTPYVFVLDDFNQSHGPWDFLRHPKRAAGTLSYSRPDGGQVSLTFITTSGAGPADCFLGGVATYAPHP